MGWFYIFVRTFPFWAIPIGIALFTAALRTKGGNKKKKLTYSLLSLFLLSGSAFFLYVQGHQHAVPFFHQLFYGE